ncbi:Scarecrow-like protein 28 [Ananas comosus]|uniref:Scarecrow-like protein 28 n=1 Tax=Ananas comosus TaxID=4615 RepID=A0A199V7P4_ANACO|nr:Scarecrow-like protein 28 [Ananas comosus]
MLAGWHQYLRSEASLQLQVCQFQLQEKMGTQRLDLPCGFAKRENHPRVSLSLEKPIDPRSTSCSFRQNPLAAPSSSSLVAKIEPTDQGALWEESSRRLKRFHERDCFEESILARAKRTRTGEAGQLVCSGGGGGSGGGDEDIWFPESIERTPFVEEEKVFLVPSAASFPVDNTSLVGSFESEKDFEWPNTKSQSDSSSSSGTGGLSPKPEIETENRNDVVAYTVGGAGVDESTRIESEGLGLLNLLTSCVEAIGAGNHEAVNYLLARLGEQASPKGTPIHRVVAYFTEAVALRVAKLWPHIFSITSPRELTDHLEDEENDAIALRLLNHVSPIPKFLHFTCNERLLRAFEGKERVHIVDFDIKQGLQWPSLFQSLASRPQPPAHVRITGVGECRQELLNTGVRLSRFAEALNLPFEFHAVTDRLEDVRLWMLHVKRDECVAVNCMLVMHKLLYDETGSALMDFLGLIRSVKPEVVLTAEQEADHNDERWELRLGKSVQYYSAVFDSLDLCLASDSPAARAKIEQMFAREIRNLVACEGDERFERHERFSKWIKKMEDGGYRSAGIGEREIVQSQLILRMYASDKYSVEKRGEGVSEGLSLRWVDQPLYTVSAWALSEVGGSSSTSQPC